MYTFIIKRSLVVERHKGMLSSSSIAPNNGKNIFTTPPLFCSHRYLRKSLDCLTFGCTVSELRGISFLSLGQLSLVIPHHVSSCLAEVVTVVKEGLSPTNRRKGYVITQYNVIYCLFW